MLTAGTAFQHPTRRPNELWQTDFTYRHVVSWGWYCLSTVLDDRMPGVHRPRLLSDNGPCYISGQLATYLETHGLPHTRSAPYHPMSQGKIERYHRSLKNVVKLEQYYSPGRWNRRSPASQRSTITAAITSRCRT